MDCHVYWRSAVVHVGYVLYIAAKLTHCKRERRQPVVHVCLLLRIFVIHGLRIILMIRRFRKILHSRIRSNHDLNFESDRRSAERFTNHNSTKTVNNTPGQFSLWGTSLSFLVHYSFVVLESPSIDRFWGKKQVVIGMQPSSWCRRGETE